MLMCCLTLALFHNLFMLGHLYFIHMYGVIQGYQLAKVNNIFVELTIFRLRKLIIVFISLKYIQLESIEIVAFVFCIHVNHHEFNPLAVYYAFSFGGEGLLRLVIRFRNVKAFLTPQIFSFITYNAFVYYNDKLVERAVCRQLLLVFCCLL